MNDRRLKTTHGERSDVSTALSNPKRSTHWVPFGIAIPRRTSRKINDIRATRRRGTIGKAGRRNSMNLSEIRYIEER